MMLHKFNILFGILRVSNKNKGSAIFFDASFIFYLFCIAAL